MPSIWRNRIGQPIKPIGWVGMALLLFLQEQRLGWEDGRFSSAIDNSLLVPKVYEVDQAIAV
jgi:hypothetical protein